MRVGIELNTVDLKRLVVLELQSILGTNVVLKESDVQIQVRRADRAGDEWVSAAFRACVNKTQDVAEEPTR